MKKISRKEREYRTRREEILKAAESAFAQKGFHNSTVAEIAKESEFAIGTIYQFFKNKEELYYIMMIEKFDLLYSTLLNGVGKNIKCSAKLLCLVEIVFAFIEGNVDFFKVFTWELNVLNSNMNNRLKDQLVAKDLQSATGFTEDKSPYHCKPLFKWRYPRELGRGFSDNCRKQMRTTKRI